MSVKTGPKMDVTKKSAGKQSRNLVERAVITKDSQNAVTEYFLSKQADRDIKKYPEWDAPRSCPAFEVIKAHQDLESAEEELRKKRAEQKVKRQDMDERWSEMRRQELVLRHSFIKFNKFVKENREKRERAESKIKDEVERQRQRQGEIGELERKLERLKSIREKMQQFVAEYKKYQMYLEKVVDETAEFRSINEIFNRYETLIEARMTLSELQDKHLKALEDKGNEIHRMAEAKSQMLMELTNKLVQLQSRYDKAKAHALKWESIVSRIKATAASKNLELTQVRTCCWNVYQQICKRKGVPAKVSRDDVEQQLIHIKRTILELKRIIRAAKKRAAKEEKLY